MSTITTISPMNSLSTARLSIFLLRARPTMPPPIPHIAPITEARKLTMKKMIKTVVSLIDCMDSRL